MSGNRYLLDSNIIIDVFRGDAKAIDRMKGIEEVYVPAIVIGELFITGRTGLIRLNGELQKLNNYKQRLIF